MRKQAISRPCFFSSQLSTFFAARRKRIDTKATVSRFFITLESKQRPRTTNVNEIKNVTNRVQMKNGEKRD